MSFAARVQFKKATTAPSAPTATPPKAFKAPAAPVETTAEGEPRKRGGRVAKPKPAPSYRSQRKYSVGKLEPMMNSPEAVVRLRQRIGSRRTGELSAVEFIDYLKAIETDEAPWRKRGRQEDGTKPKRGRPAKGAKRIAAAPPKVADAKTTLAQAAKGGLLKLKNSPLPKAPPPAPAAKAPAFKPPFGKK